MSARFHHAHEYIAVKIDAYDKDGVFVLDCSECGVIGTATTKKECTGQMEIHLIETHGAPYDSIVREEN